MEGIGYVQFLSNIAGIERRMLDTSGGRRLRLASLSRLTRETMVHIRMNRIADMRVWGFASMADRVGAGIGRFEPSSLRSTFLFATGRVW